MALRALLPDLLCDVCNARRFAVTLEPRLRKRRWRKERQYGLEV
ncbi:rCG50607 [Rattus norvegicus]|uniref:RCG50607 n=1 Tax=Rattus norvegicus TaxID=10116 RepID=A6KCY7_RAT|nr:rCG50607 [Rattus norvegicus]